jgi:opacity protein-like surface antigen
MRKRALIAVTLITLAMAAGCAKHVTAPVPGSLNTFDSYAYRVLADAQAAINDFKASVASGKVPETPTLKTVLNQAITDYNAANMAYQAWRAAGGNGMTAPIAAALNQVNADITNITANGGK